MRHVRCLKFVAARATLVWLLMSPIPRAVAALADVVPAPVFVQPLAGTTYTLSSNTRLFVEAGSSAAAVVAEQLALILRRSTGYALPISEAPRDATDGISLLLSGAPTSVGAEGYQLDVSANAVMIRAQTAAGLAYGVQTLRQLLPPQVESGRVTSGPWTMSAGRIIDYPRFSYRGSMLDVARHFLPVAVVKRYIDRIALYKMNHLHLHLSDDQGWRIVIDAWPRLATVGGSTQVGGGPGGYYTKAQFAEIVTYAAQRHITIVPEIDMPGHSNAALASYAELNCNGQAPPLYTGTAVGFSSLCTTKEITYTFVNDVLRELAAMTPGPYLHIGGDEARVTPHDKYAAFLNRVQPMVTSKNKTVIAWHESGAPDVQQSAGRVVQYWGTSTADSRISSAVSRGAKVLMSPANRTYLDMMYDANTPIGLSWAGYIELDDAYGWDPGTHLTAVPASAVLGVEAPLWTETVITEEHVELMMFPRLPAIAELGWSPWSTHDWQAFRQRLASHGPRWTILGIDYYRSPQVAWGTVPGVALVNRASGLCLDLPRSSQANGVAPIVWGCHGGANQRWTLTAESELRVLNGLKCLDAQRSGTAPGTRLLSWNCHNGSNQKWTPNNDGTITGVHSGHCVTANGTAAGSPVLLSTCTGASTQIWIGTADTP